MEEDVLIGVPMMKNLCADNELLRIYESVYSYPVS
jgi:hypothetical protein